MEDPAGREDRADQRSVERAADQSDGVSILQPQQKKETAPRDRGGVSLNAVASVERRAALDTWIWIRAENVRNLRELRRR